MEAKLPTLQDRDRQRRCCLPGPLGGHGEGRRLGRARWLKALSWPWRTRALPHPRSTIATMLCGRCLGGLLSQLLHKYTTCLPCLLYFLAVPLPLPQPPFPHPAAQNAQTSLPPALLRSFHTVNEFVIQNAAPLGINFQSQYQRQTDSKE